MVKNERGLIDHGTPKWDVSHKWFDKLSIHWIIFTCWSWWNNFWFDGQSTLYLWQFNAGRPLQLYVANVFRKIPSRQKCAQNRIFFFIFFISKCFHWFWQETYFNEHWYYSEFDLMDRNLGFTVKFWISTTEVFVITKEKESP